MKTVALIRRIWKAFMVIIIRNNPDDHGLVPSTSMVMTY